MSFKSPLIKAGENDARFDATLYLVKNTFPGQVNVTNGNMEKQLKELLLWKTSPMRLKLLCVWAIRGSMSRKSDEDFLQLGLPPALMSLVSYHKLAEDIADMLNEDFLTG